MWRSWRHRTGTFWNGSIYEYGAKLGHGYRNGTRKGKPKTAECMIDYSVPQIARRDRPFKSVIRVPFWGYTAALDDLTLAAHQDPTLI